MSALVPTRGARRLRVGLLAASVAAGLLVFTATASAQAQGCPTDGNLFLQSAENDRYVTTAVDPALPTGALTATAAEPSAQSGSEMFTMTRVGWSGRSAVVVLQFGDRYVSAEVGRGFRGGAYGMLRARQKRVGRWERFVLECKSVGELSSVVSLKSLANNRYVSAEVGYTGPPYGLLRARATRVRAWETFILE